MFVESGGFTPLSEDVDTEVARYRREGNHWLRYQFAGSLLRGDSLLEVGCGCGVGLLALSPHFKQACGVDSNPGAIAWAVRCVSPLAPTTTFTSSDLGELGLHSLFDLAIAFEVLEHVREPSKFLESVCSVVRPGGSILLSTPNGAYSRHIPALFRTHFHVDEYSATELLRILPQSLRLIRMYGQRRVDLMDVVVLRYRLWLARQAQTPIATAGSGSTHDHTILDFRRISRAAYQTLNGPLFWTIKAIRNPTVDRQPFSTLLLHLVKI